MARVSVFVVISFMTVSFFSMFAVRPTLTTIGQLIREIEDKRQIVERLDKKLSQLEQAQEEYVQIEDDSLLLWGAIPAEPQLSKFILQLEVLALQKNVNLVNFQIEPVTLLGIPTKVAEKKAGGEKGAPMVSVNITAGGSFEQVKEFVRMIERLERLMVVNEVNWSVGTPFLKREGAEVTASIRGKVYFVPEGGKGVS